MKASEQPFEEWPQDEREVWKEYVSLLHAMQSGVAMEMNYNPNPTSPKHLRVGINATMSDHGALAHLLVDKGVFTRKEMLLALRDGMKREVDAYQERIKSRMGDGADVKLG